jgi:putative transposase
MQHLSGSEHKKIVSPSQKRRAVFYFLKSRLCSLSVVCRALSLTKSSYYYRPRFSLFEFELIKSLHLLCRRFPRYGYSRITVMLRYDGWRVNQKRIQRLMRLDGLKVISKPKKRKRLGVSTSECRKAEHVGHVWSWDFVFDRTEDGRQLKILGIIDEYTRECLCLKAARYFTSVDVINDISALIQTRGVPEHIRSDNGPEFITIALKDWVESKRIGTIYINPGSPWENA